MLASVSDDVLDQFRGSGDIALNESMSRLVVEPSDKIADALLRDRIAEPDPVAQQPLERLERREPGQLGLGAGDIAGENEPAQRHRIGIPGVRRRRNLASLALFGAALRRARQIA